MENNIDYLYDVFLSSNQNVCTDTRKIHDGCIFFALKGPNFNGNKFVKEAINKGATLAVIDEEEHQLEENTILVNNVLQTLQQLALYHRKKFKLPIIGITGTNGKTTTKELLGTVLKSQKNPLITKGNLNNHIGVPLTLLQLKNTHDIAVIEMGASKKGDIKELVDIALPTHGLITNIGKAHLDGFGSLDNIRKTKMELYDFLIQNNGMIIYNEDDPILKESIPNELNQFSYGQSNADLLGKVVNNNPYVKIKYNKNQENTNQIKTNLLGGYNLYNILAAISIGSIFSIDNQSIINSISNYQPSNHRSQLIKTKKNIILADCYNANPTSTLESLISFNNMKNKKKIAILGDMLELGKNSLNEHQVIVDYLAENKLDAFLVGQHYSETVSKFNNFGNTEELIQLLKTKGYSDYLILLKGSRGIQLEKILDKNIL